MTAERGMSPRTAVHKIASAFFRFRHAKYKESQQKALLVNYAIREQEWRAPSSRRDDQRILPPSLSRHIKTLLKGTLTVLDYNFVYEIHQLECFSLFLKAENKLQVIWLFHVFAQEAINEFGSDPKDLANYLESVIQYLVDILPRENFLDDFRQ
jgi:hypothetical protein